jgi:hypothetical protein
MKEDLEQIRLLGIFHYVVASLYVLFGCIPIIYLSLGIAIAVGAFPPDNRGQQIPSVIGWVIACFGAAAMVAIWTYAISLALSGRSLRQHRRYTFCLVMAIISCMFMPFGTILGIFTLIVLFRPSVKELFAAAHAGPMSDDDSFRT